MGDEAKRDVWLNLYGGARVRPEQIAAHGDGWPSDHELRRMNVRHTPINGVPKSWVLLENGWLLPSSIQAESLRRRLRDIAEGTDEGDG